MAEVYFMSEISTISTFLGVDSIAAVCGVLMAFIGVCAFFTAVVTEGLKRIRRINRLPTKLVCYVVALVLTTPVFLAMMAFMGQPVAWYMVFASFLASFVVAKVSMSGWDDVTELAGRLIRK